MLTCKIYGTDNTDTPINTFQITQFFINKQLTADDGSESEDIIRLSLDKSYPIDDSIFSELDSLINKTISKVEILDAAGTIQGTFTRYNKIVGYMIQGSELLTINLMLSRKENTK